MLKWIPFIILFVLWATGIVIYLISQIRLTITMWNSTDPIFQWMAHNMVGFAILMVLMWMLQAYLYFLKKD